MGTSQETDVRSWTLPLLQSHLQSLVDLEFWTIPFYAAALYSIRDRGSPAFRLIQAVVHEEMMHTQFACNIANAYGLSPSFPVPVYRGKNVPHLIFALDTPNPTQFYTPYSAEIGPCDIERLNTMCLIEYPEWDTHRKPDVSPDATRYGSIGEFYVAVSVGMIELREHLRGGVNQVDQFGSYYNGVAHPTITEDGMPGLRQALALTDVIVAQGEGQTEGETDVPVACRNTADGYEDSWPHFRKFNYIRGLAGLPATYGGDPNPPPGSSGRTAQDILVRDFAEFTELLTQMFAGRPHRPFGVLMAKIGGDIVTCWQHGAVPRFS